MHRVTISRLDGSEGINYHYTRSDERVVILSWIRSACRPVISSRMHDSTMAFARKLTVTVLAVTVIKRLTRQSGADVASALLFNIGVDSTTVEYVDCMFRARGLSICSPHNGNSYVNLGGKLNETRGKLWRISLQLESSNLFGSARTTIFESRGRNKLTFLRLVRSVLKILERRGILEYQAPLSKS